MKSLLIVVDMQNDFIDGKLGSQAARDIVPNVADLAERWQGDIFFTMDTHSRERYELTEEGQQVPFHCELGTTGWEMNYEVFRALCNQHDITGSYQLSFRKETFGTTEFLKYLDIENYENITFCGVCTDICVISNALMLRSLRPCLQIAVEASCCAGSTPERHKAALDIMKSCQIKIINEGQ